MFGPWPSKTPRMLIFWALYMQNPSWLWSSVFKPFLQTYPMFGSCSGSSPAMLTCLSDQGVCIWDCLHLIAVIPAAFFTHGKALRTFGLVSELLGLARFQVFFGKVQ